MVKRRYENWDRGEQGLWIGLVGRVGWRTNLQEESTRLIIYISIFISGLGQVGEPPVGL